MKNKFELEYILNTSPSILYNRLSTPEGLSEWFADDVNLKRGRYTFIWEGTEQDAAVVQKKRNKFIRFQWDDEDSDTYFEFRIRTLELTGDVALLITDFAEDDEKDDAVDLWDTQVAELRHAIGL
ncbi:MAG: START-like domain-containing protein [Bacteroidales bacterium]